MKERLAKLINVKTIVTIVLTIVFAFMLISGATIPEEFLVIYTTVIAFYFGTQFAKAENDASKNSDVESGQ